MAAYLVSEEEALTRSILPTLTHYNMEVSGQTSARYYSHSQVEDFG